MFLEFKNVVKNYGKVQALKGVSFQIDKGEIVCILGPSGCGKTTVLQALGGFIDIDQGQIILDGQDITRLGPEKRPIATVFQSYGLFPNMNVIDNISYGLKFRSYNKKERYEKAREILVMLGMENYEKTNVTRLSGGEQQRVALGRALIVEPKLLLLDEPLSNLDAKLRVSMRKELLRIRDLMDITMVFVTHDQEDAFSIGDRIILMNKGLVEQIGSGEELYYQPETSFALEFIGSVNLKDNNYYIRPESIVEDEEGRPAKIIDKIFKASIIEYIIEVDGEKYRMIKLSNSQEYQIGQTIKVRMEMKKL